ncbi:Aste57867_23261 [Aphanomyces stellatus]|uniref:phosphatidylinositol-3,5-bisphosphate 3-phosphatase n=1 Tax=Aphanomyces stellatus TaxID=120398 RepID=A0A485LN26_9STRA|nr:hypothetical protein As57867_023190 [Aphanomyces stellatus]VFT99906.1 Aste57867_23261 [Aphanomyces stellatus]
MRLTILRGENIGSTEHDGHVDAYVRVVYDGKEVGMTQIVRRTANPIWDLEMRVPLLESWDMNVGASIAATIDVSIHPSSQIVAYVVIEVKCNDGGSEMSEYLSTCRANLSLMQDAKEATSIKCRLLRGTSRQGWIHISMQLEDTETSYFNKSRRMDVRDVFPPHNERFNHLFAPIPRTWHPLGDCIVPSNEKILYIVEEVSLTFHVTEANQGVLALMVLTTFRLWFIPYTPVRGLNHEDVHTIPLGKIAKLTQTQMRHKDKLVHGLTIENMDAGYYTVTLNARVRDGDTEGKRVRMLGHIVGEIEWLQIENNFCAFNHLNILESHPEANVLAEHRPVGMSPMVSSSFLSDASPITMSGLFAQTPPPPLLRSASSMSMDNGHAVGKHRDGQPLMSPIATNPANKRRVRYDPNTEFTRQGALSHPAWRKTTINENYALCGSYPHFLVVPASIPDDILAEAARFRSKKRHPALTWIHPRTGAALCRSSQPKSGVLRTHNKDDRDLLWAIRDAAFAVDTNARPKPNTLVHIVDCRPEINAKSNALAGKGHESAKHYDRDGTPCASIAFMGIDNIHVVRSSFNQLSQALYQVDDSTFHSTLQKSRWLEHINSILVGATDVASHLERGDAVLVHCSDGWDRTSQLCALGQLMLDPYFRTLEGFAILIEKDWCSFGHKFAQRCGYPATDESSPVFQQFLDAVYQLTLQFPTHFQFNELFLSTIADAVYSSWYGTFQKNNERERKEFTEAVPTISVWDTIRASTDMYRNPLFNTDKDDAMLPVCRVRLMQLWTSQHQKAISHMRLQQREVEMLALIRQQERDLMRLRDMLTPEQSLEIKNAELRSEIQRLSRKIAIHHEALLPTSVTSTPSTTPNKNKALRRLNLVVSPSNGAAADPSSVSPPELLRSRTSSFRVKTSLAALLTGNKPAQSDLASMRMEFADLTRQLDAVRVIAATLDEEAFTMMQQLRFQNFNTPLEEVSIQPEYIRDESSLLLSPPQAPTNTSSMVSATLSNSFSNATRNVSLLAMTDFNAHHNHRRHTLQNGVTLNGNGPTSSSRSYSSMQSRSNTQPVWESDKDAACCKQCKKKFIAVVRNRHHCRCCGYVFCGKCTNHRMSLPEFGYFEEVRVCRVCFNTGGGEEQLAPIQDN